MSFKTPKNTNSVSKQLDAASRATVLRLGRTPTPDWLSKPPYYRYIDAALRYQSNSKDVDPKVPRVTSKFNEYQVAVWKSFHDPSLLSDEERCVLQARAFNDSPHLRSHLNGLFFGGADVEQVHATTNIPIESVAAYQNLFADMSVFQDVPIFMMDYVQLLPEIAEDDKTEKTLYLQALTYGWEWVVWKMSRGMAGHRNNTQVIDTMINLAFYRGMEAGTHPLDSAKGKETRQYIKLAAQLAISRHIAKVGVTTSIQDMVVRLTAMKPEEAQDMVKRMAEESDMPLPEIEALLYGKPTDENGENISFPESAWSN